jgi:hypothetical protein
MDSDEEMSPELAAAIEVEMWLEDRHNPLLRERTKKWLRHNPERLNEFVASDYTRHPGHYRRLTYDENWELTHWWWTPEQRKAERDTHRRFGGVIADALYQTANREGFMRKYLRMQDTPTVPEYTKAEKLLAERIVRRNHMPRSKIRPLALALRKANVT